MVRSAGAYAQLMAKEGSLCPGPPALRRSPQSAPCTASATIGTVGNTDHENIRIGKAGRKRHMGIRPTVRGVVMNPVRPSARRRRRQVAHRHARSGDPLGQDRPLATKTRKHKKYSNRLIVKRINDK